MLIMDCIVRTHIELKPLAAEPEHKLKVKLNTPGKSVDTDGIYMASSGRPAFTVGNYESAKVT